MVNGRVVQALVDTGSGYTLVHHATALRLGAEINERRTPPKLQGVTGSPLRILGMVCLEIGIGEQGTSKLWLPVVPDNYIENDILLGCDVLGQAPMTWNHKQGTLVWGGTLHPIRYVAKRHSEVERVRIVPETIEPFRPTLRVNNPIEIPSFQTELYPLTVSELPGTILLVSPHQTPRHDFVCRVTEERQVFVPLYNPNKTHQIFRKGTYLGSYEPVQVIEELDSPGKGPDVAENKVHTNISIKNDLLPHADHPREKGSREDKLKSLLALRDFSHLSEEEKKVLLHVIQENNELFILHPSEIGKIRAPPVKIAVENPIPVRGPKYRYPEKAKAIIEKLVGDMEEKGVIEPSTAAWLSPIVLVSKPDGSKRMCLDYRGVNKHLATDIYPLPRLEELVEVASGNKYYATLDLKEAYFQVELEENSRDLTTFSDGVSLYRFKRLPFGLSCSPAIFSRQIAQVLTPLIKQGWVKNYLDDIVIFGPDFQTLVGRLSQLFNTLREKGVKVNISKSKFGQRQVKFLGHILSEKGCQPDPANIEAIVAPPPKKKNIREVRRFLGMCGFYRKPVPSYAEITAPLTDLTRKTPFLWTQKCQKAFEQMKEKLTQAPILVRADVTKPFSVTTDASNTRVGGVLSQIAPDGTNRAIGYFSRKLKPTELMLLWIARLSRSSSPVDSSIIIYGGPNSLS